MENISIKSFKIIAIYQSVIIFVKVWILPNFICTKMDEILIYREVEQCQSILGEMEQILKTYQVDLDHAVDEIKNLQVVL